MEYNLYKMREMLLKQTTLTPEDVQAMRILDNWYEGLLTEDNAVNRLVKLERIANNAQL